MMLRAAIVDDEPLAIEGLKAQCARVEDVEIVATAADGEAALRLLDAQRPDFLFLDIGMPGLTGIDVAGRLPQMPDPPLVIFATAYGHFATEAFDLGVTDYILKPIEADRLTRAIERVRTAIARAGVHTAASPRVEELWVPDRGAMLRLAFNSISHIEAYGDYVRIHSATRAYLLRQTMSAIEKRLDPSRFIRIHRSAIVRKECIRGLKHLGSGAWAAVAGDGRLTRIGRGYLSAVRQELGILVGE